MHFAHEDCGFSILGDIKKLTGHSPKQPDLAALALAGRWTRQSQEMTSKLSCSVSLRCLTLITNVNAFTSGM